MADDAYRLSDEPQPGALARVAVRPLWPLLGVMFAGPWLSWPWFIVNGIAVGSPTRRRELAVAVGGLLGSIVFVAFLVAGAAFKFLPRSSIPYLFTLLLVWRLAVSYWLYTLQARTFGIYEYYGGAANNGLPILVAGLVADGALLVPLTKSLGGAGAIVRMVLG